MPTGERSPTYRPHRRQSNLSGWIDVGSELCRLWPMRARIPWAARHGGTVSSHAVEPPRRYPVLHVVRAIAAFVSWTLVPSVSTLTASNLPARAYDGVAGPFRPRCPPLPQRRHKQCPMSPRARHPSAPCATKRGTIPRSLARRPLSSRSKAPSRAPPACESAGGLACRAATSNSMGSDRGVIARSIQSRLTARPIASGVVSRVAALRALRSLDPRSASARQRGLWRSRSLRRLDNPRFECEPRRFGSMIAAGQRRHPSSGTSRDLPHDLLPLARCFHGGAPPFTCPAWVSQPRPAFGLPLFRRARDMPSSRGVSSRQKGQRASSFPPVAQRPHRKPRFRSSPLNSPPSLARPAHGP